MSAVRGIVLGQDADKLIIQATATDVVRFGVGTPVGVAEHQMLPFGKSYLDMSDLMMHGYLYDRVGRRIAAIQTVHLRQQQVEVTTFDQATATSLPGRLWYEIMSVVPA